MSTYTFKKFEPQLLYDAAIKKANSIIEELSVEERIELIGGHNFFYIKEVEEAGLPALYMTDATQGVNIRRNLPDQLEKSVAFPCPILLTATWNRELAYKYAKSIGEECRAGGAHFLLGPGMNIYRISQNGRNFEYFGEDPFLAARMIENYVVGMQSTGTIATLKHFVANNTDFMRRKSNSVVDLRSLHEIYLPAFKAGIEAGAMAVMTSYNLVNGEYAAESKFVITELLREQLGFKWLVMSDWWSITNPEKAIKSGLDIEMPGHDDDRQPNIMALGDVYVRSRAKQLLNEGKVSIDDITRMATNVVATGLAMGFNIRNQKDKKFLDNFNDHENIALQTAREGIVLLKNEDGILPLKPTRDSSILLTGEFVDNIPGGGGSAVVEGFNHVSMRSAFENEFGHTVYVSESPSDDQIKEANTVIVSIGTLDAESWDMPFEFSEKTNNLIVRYAALNSNIIVVVNSGAGRNMNVWNNIVKGIVYSWYPGQNGYKALAEIFSGKTNPSGKLPISIEKTFNHSPGYGYVPEGEFLYIGEPNDFDVSYKPYNVNYNEGIFVGYRWYEKNKIEPLYPFGYGLSYTQFEYTDLLITKSVGSAGLKVTVKFILKNRGEFNGMEIAQIYIKDIESTIERPEKELKGFEKVYLKAGEQKEVYVELEEADFSYFNESKKEWTMESGEFEVMVGSSSSQVYLNEFIVL